MKEEGGITPGDFLPNGKRRNFFELFWRQLERIDAQARFRRGVERLGKSRVFVAQQFLHTLEEQWRDGNRRSWHVDIIRRINYEERDANTRWVFVSSSRLFFKKVCKLTKLGLDSYPPFSV
jgi:hypothetical protein